MSGTSSMAALLAALFSLPAFAAAREDGPVELAEAVRQQIVKLLPPAGRGQQCEKPAQVQPTAVVLRDRGHGALLVALLTSCNGETDFSFASGCDQDHVSGYQSLVRVGEARRLLRLRLEQRCGGGLSSVRCEVWHLNQGQLEKRGSCALPFRLQESELRKVGWK